MNVFLFSETGVDPEALSTAAELWGLVSDDEATMALVMTPTRLELRKRDEPKLGGIYVDFVHGALAYRRRFAGGRSEAIARAVNIKPGYRPNVVDATAGLGRDAFILATLGCHVRMLERNPVVAALLHDGLMRGWQDNEIGPWLRERMTLLYTCSLSALKGLNPAPQVVCLDPMYPPRKKSARVKKDMHLLQMLVGEDTDADALLAPACALASRRVVVKRPCYAQPLAGVTPQATMKMQHHRFDLYVISQESVISG